jgi:UTP--glucose-1-phosphate uridylyltransferase
MGKKVTKVVIPVAGYGTRFLPYTKSIPKEMLPIVDRPVIHHLAEECAAAGITEIILVTGMNKRAIEDYFDYNLELDYLLEKSGKHSQKALSRDIADIANFIYIRQKEQLGNGHALYQAHGLIDEDEPFMVMYGDEMFMGAPSKVQQLIDAYEQYQEPVFLSMHMDKPGDYDKYGYVIPGTQRSDDIWEVHGVVEKPGKDAAPSTLANVGAQILTGDIFKILEHQKPGKNGEILLVDAMEPYTKNHTLLTKIAQNLTYFDCGNKLEYMKATIEFALQRDDIGPDLRDFLLNRAKTL